MNIDSRSISSKTTVQLYAVEDDLSDWMYNLHLPKPFIKTDETMPMFDQYGKISAFWHCNNQIDTL